MSYEHRIYIIDKPSWNPDETGKKFAKVIASFNFCSYPNFQNVFKRKTDCYIYADHGDERIFEDFYGEELTESALSDVIKFLENEVQRGETYRRIKPLLGLLKSFDESQWKNLVCLHYGY